MKSKLSKIAFALVLAVTASAAQSKKLDTAQIEELTGLKGKLNDQENVYKVSAPRTDLKISVDKWEMPPFMGLTSWASFMPGMKGEAMVMGDLVLMQDEVNPVISAAFDNGLQVTALHNHFFFDEPKVYFMHIGGEVGKEMGVNTWAAFAGADDNAVVDGDFVVLEDELQPALKSLRKSGINIVAIHHHMICEEPRMIFFHYWGRGPAKQLASAIKTALQTTKTMAAPPK